jgi:hypothetical protein
MLIAHISATAQRDGDEKKISETVSVPLPRNGSVANLSFSARTSSSISDILYIALSPRSGAEPWQDIPATSTLISIRPR